MPHSTQHIPVSTSVLTSWALLLWITLKDMGHNPRPLFKQCGLDPNKLGDGAARYDTLSMAKLWALAAEHTGDEDIGIAAGKCWSCTTFHALGFAWLASSSLLDGLQRLERYSQLVNNSLIVKLERQGAQYRFSLATTADPAQKNHIGVDAGISALIKMCRMLIGDHFSPLAMELVRQHRSPEQLEAYAGISARYGQPENALFFNAAAAEGELVTGNANLVDANEHVALEYLARLNRNDVVSSVKAKIVELLPSGRATEESVAGQLHLNPRTMQRRLGQEGINFKQILNDTRREIAHNYIRNSSISLTEIAYLLGFADQANFTRAFRRWTGSPPSEHRKAILSKKTASI